MAARPRRAARRVARAARPHPGRRAAAGRQYRLPLHLRGDPARAGEPSLRRDLTDDGRTGRSAATRETPIEERSPGVQAPGLREVAGPERPGNVVAVGA